MATCTVVWSAGLFLSLCCWRPAHSTRLTHSEEQRAAPPARSDRTTCNILLVDAMIYLMELSLYRWERKARAQLGSSHRVLQTETNVSFAFSPWGTCCFPSWWRLGTAHCLPLYCSMSCWVINSPDHRQDKGQVAVLALLQTVSPHDDHTWSPSCCCSCPSATLAQSLFSRREPPFTRAETPASLQDCAHSHTCCHAYMGHFCMSLEEPGGSRLSALGYHLPSASF